MAKYGEGDKRWIVEDRPDGTNVHNWHWAERNFLEWSRSFLSSLLSGLTVLDGEGGLAIRTGTLDRLDSEAYVNVRKGKVIPGYELSLSLSFEGEASDAGVKVSGTIEVPYLADENAEEDPEMKVIIRDDDGPVGRCIKDALLARGKPLILGKIREYVQAMAKGGLDLGDVAGGGDGGEEVGVGEAGEGGGGVLEDGVGEVGAVGEDGAGGGDDDLAVGEADEDGPGADIRGAGVEDDGGGREGVGLVGEVFEEGVDLGAGLEGLGEEDAVTDLGGQDKGFDPSSSTVHLREPKRPLKKGLKCRGNKLPKKAVQCHATC